MSTVCRAIDAAEACDATCWGEHCDQRPEFRVKTPYGQWDACDIHTDELMGTLTDDWINSFAATPDDLLPDDLEAALDGIPF